MREAVVLLVAAVAVAGVAAQWLGWRYRVPSILALLVIGLAVGPVFGWVHPSTILGPVMAPAVGMVVAIIVFEGGLNLNFRELRTAGSGVRRLVFLALPLNWLFGALAGHWIGHLSWPVSILFGSILVVTGPTVIIPLLRQSKLAARSAAFLRWEGIVNDPIGAVLTLLVLSFVLELHRRGEHSAAIWSLVGRALIGAAAAGVLGAGLPFALREAFRRDLAPEFLKTPILLAGALGVYAVGETIQPETGLIGATIFGMVLANIDVTGLHELHRFKESLTVFLVSGLFIMLAANIDPSVVRHVSWPILLTTVALLFLVRPAAIAIATVGARMTAKERVLLGWIAPRGAVAAAVAGIVAQQLGAADFKDGPLILPMVFFVIASSVLLHGLSLGPLARWLGLASDTPPGLLVVGAQPWTFSLARAVHRLGAPVLVTDPDWRALRPGREAGLPTAKVEILSAKGDHLVDVRDLDYLLAATDDDAYNALVCTRFAPELGRERVHQVPPDPDGPHAQTQREWRGKFTPHPDLTNERLNALIAEGYDFRVRDGAEIAPVDSTDPWPVVVIAPDGAMNFYSPDQAVSAPEGDRVICFERGLTRGEERTSSRGVASGKAKPRGPPGQDRKARAGRAKLGALAKAE